MSDNPYDAPKMSGPPVLPSGQRPTSATVLGILNIIFGIWGFCGVFGGAMVIAMIFSGQFDSQPGFEAFGDPLMMGYTIVQAAMGFLLSVLIIFAGIGLLQFRPWGRTASIYYAIIKLLLVVAGIIVMVLQMFPLTAAWDPQNPVAVSQLFGAIGGIVGSCFEIAYPIILLVFMNRAAFKQAILPASN